MEGLLIRRALAEDGSALARLRLAMDEEEGVAAEPEFVSDFEKWWQANHQRFAALVAEIGGDIIGTVWLELVERVPRPSEPVAAPIGYVTFTFVEADRRDVGVGTAMLEHVRDLAHEAGVELLIVWPSDRSRPLYGRIGFQATDEPLVLRLQ